MSLMNRRGLLFAAFATLSPSIRAAVANDLRDVGLIADATAATGDRLLLADGREARLSVIEAASPPPGADPGRRWPLAEAARAALAQALQGEKLRLWGQNAEPDRHGRLSVHAQRQSDGAWLQEILLAGGHARVRPAPGDDARARDLLRVEDAARRGGRGIWASRVYAVRPAADAQAVARDIGLLTVTEGRPVRAEARSGKIYLDFGDDWRRDFTAVVPGAVARALKKEGVDPAGLAGRSLRVRGWPEWRFGPQIEIIVPAQLEVVD